MPTLFIYLDDVTRSLFKLNHRHLKEAMNTWYWSGHVDLWYGHKTLEDEIKHLEQVSYIAYKAAKILKDGLKRKSDK